jgi:fermentation-respiration switch protein FrsA (DUF1100 family)
LGIDYQDIAPVKGIAKYNVPTLLISGADDPFATVDQQEKLLQAIRGHKELWLIPGGKHEDLSFVAGAEYERRILEFIKEQLKI